MELEQNITGISDNLSESIIEKTIENEQIEELPLSKLKVAISISDSEELDILGLSEYHLKDVSIELARYLIVNGATMLYGGDLRNGGFTNIFAELSFQYKYLKTKKDHFINYFPFPQSNNIDIDAQASFKVKQVKPILLELSSHLTLDDPKRQLNPTICEDRFIIAECLSAMRKKIVSDSNAKVLIGGRNHKFIGYFPGVVEEALCAVRSKQPIYLLGGFGGAAKSIISIITGNSPYELSNDYQYDSDFSKSFRSYVTTNSDVCLDYDIVISEFSGLTIESISERNGLSIEENQILFESTNIHELVFLVIKGLIQISKA